MPCLKPSPSTALAVFCEHGRLIHDHRAIALGGVVGLDVVAQHIELTPETEPVTGLAMSASRRTVLQPTGEPFDAAAAMRAEREAQARRGERG